MGQLHYPNRRTPLIAVRKRYGDLAPPCVDRRVVMGGGCSGMLIEAILSEITAIEPVVGLEVPFRMASVCVNDMDGEILKAAKFESEPHVAASPLDSLAGSFVGWVEDMPTGPVAPSRPGRSRVPIPIFYSETGHMTAALSAQIDKTDRKRATAIACSMRVDLCRPVHNQDRAQPGDRDSADGVQLCSVANDCADGSSTIGARMLCHDADRPPVEGMVSLVHAVGAVAA